METPVRIGDCIAGKYDVDSVLGRGGMGVVVAARHRQLGHRVAIKFLLGDWLTPDALARFEREARALAALRGDHVTRVFDIGELENGVPYMVLEYLEGEDLARLLKRSGPLSTDDAVQWMLQACQAMAEAHRIGIVHRDLKPSNIFLSLPSDGTRVVKILDFGISKAPVGRDSTALTKTAALMGSPLYMSPEQIREAKDVDARSDVWSLGATFYELLLGRPPFMSPAFGELCSMILSQPVGPVCKERTDVPELVSATIARCLQKDPGERFAHAGELEKALRQSFQPLHGEGTRTAPSRVATELLSEPQRRHPGALAQVGVTSPPTSLTNPPVQRVARNRWTLIAITALSSSALGALFYTLDKGEVRPDPALSVPEVSHANKAASAVVEVEETAVVRDLAVASPDAAARVFGEAETVTSTVAATVRPAAPSRSGTTSPSRAPRRAAPAPSRDLLEDHY